MYEYKVVPAPNRGEKSRGAKTPADRFATAMASQMNELAREGWEYLRADTLPCEERSGLTKRVTVYHSVLVFRRALAAATEAAVEAPRRMLTTDAPEGKTPGIAAPSRQADVAETTPALGKNADHDTDTDNLLKAD